MADAPLFRTWPMPRTIARKLAQQGEAPVAFPKSVRLDFAAGDLVTDGRGRSQPTDGETAWRQWCLKACMVQQGRYPIYSRDFGVDRVAILRESSPSTQRAMLERAVPVALLRDLRTREARVEVTETSDDLLRFTIHAISRNGASLSEEVALRG